MRVTDAQTVYCIGLGGIGVSALAQFLRSRGVRVSGSDRSASPVTELLKERGVRVMIGTDQSNVPEDADLVVYSDAVGEDNPERVRARSLGIPEQSYFAALGELSREYTTVLVTGTHGKTTTTGMLGKILIDTGREPTVIAGSIMKEFGSNFVQGKSNLLVVEGCEYRRHFLHFSPRVLLINNIEWDHTDYYTTFADMQSAFGELCARVEEEGVIIANPKDPVVSVALPDNRTVVDYTKEEVPELILPGEFNRMNARAAFAAAKAVAPNLDEDRARQSLKTFSGTWRRFEYKGKTKNDVSVYDDYAHHPTAVRKTIAAARERFADHRLVVAFHPHLFSRTRDFMDDFALALAGADEVVLAPIYPAREEPIPDITSEVLAKKITALGTTAQAFDSLDAVYNELSAISHQPSAIFTMGAGDIYTVAEQLTKE